jgi:hypothetical protein
MRVKFCHVCCIKTPRDENGECLYCQEQKENDRKEKQDEFIKFAVEVSEIKVREYAMMMTARVKQL